MLVRLTLISCLLSAIVCSPQRVRADDKNDQPNIIFMVVDDQSWNGLSIPMHPEWEYAKNEHVQTPNVAKLAAQGMRFSAAYAAAPVCAPSRLALQTGRSPAVLHWTRAGPSVKASDGYKLNGPINIKALSEKETTVGEMLKAAGYATAHFGKWHIQGGGPGTHGYDEHDGNLGNEHASKFAGLNPVDIFGMTDRAITFMKQSQAAKKPFFVQLSWHALHSPENALEATKAKVRKLLPGERERDIGRLALAEDLDTGVGRLLAALDALSLTSNTYVIYTSDNGGGDARKARGTGEQGLNGGKGSLYEGGIRVPFIVRGPSVAADSWCHVPVTLIDLLPTYAAWAGVSKLPDALEGGSIAQLLSDKGVGTVSRVRPPLFFHFPHYVGQGGPQSAIRVGDLKLMTFYEDPKVALFDLATDAREEKDLSALQPEQAAKLKALLDTYLKDVKAQMPVANPSYDPNTPPKVRRRGRGRK